MADVNRGNRPLSPFMLGQYYRPQMTSISSIMVRITGIASLGTAVLLVLYPALAPIRVVGTDLAHAVPLTLIAGLGHLALGHVDLGLLVALLMGSLPAIYIGTHVGHRIPNHIMHPVLVTVLLALGIKYAVF